MVGFHRDLSDYRIMNSRIPRRIIQIWGGGAELPLRARCAVTNVRLLNPDFEYLLFDDNGMEEFIKDNFPEYRSLFHSFEFNIQRYDFFRYLAIYRLGGFYFDVDVFLASSLRLSFWTSVVSFPLKR